MLSVNKKVLTALLAADDALVLDTSELTPEEVVQKIKEFIDLEKKKRELVDITEKLEKRQSDLSNGDDIE